MSEGTAQYNKQKEIIERLVKRKGQLKFGKSCVCPSDIGSQFYCEKKVEFIYILSAEKTPEMALGTIGHEGIVEDFQKVSLEEIWEHIFEEGWQWVGEMMLLSEYKDTFIYGKPDQLLFISGKPKMIFEFKFSKYQSLFPSQRIQAQTYGLELNSLGLDTTDLFYTIVVCPLEMITQMNKLKSLPEQIFTNFLKQELFKKEESTLLFGDINAYIYQFNITQAEGDLEYALEYWKGKREANLTDNTNKCISCEFKKECFIRNFVQLIEEIQVPDNAKGAHDVIEELCKEQGWTVEREYKVPDRGDGRRGSIDLVIQTRTLRIGIEIDRNTPRRKSIFKLNSNIFDIKIIFLRSNEMPEPQPNIDLIMNLKLNS